MKKLVYISSSRADFGIVSHLLSLLEKSNAIDLHVIAIGSHLMVSQGRTISEIEGQGFNQIHGLQLAIDEATPFEVTAGVYHLLPELIDVISPDAVMLLGDRFEIHACSTVLTHMNIPIIHLHGGELSYGAIDDAFRHAITKMSHLHLTSTEDHRKRVIQMGEPPACVYNIGALGVENCLKKDLMSKEAIFNELGLQTNQPLLVVTYHPETSLGHLEDQTACVIEVLDNLAKDYQIVITKSNIDQGGAYVNQEMMTLANKHDHIKVLASLGLTRYLSLVKHADAVVGNSSSGLIEVPSLKVPTVNIGSRQLGRSKGPSVFDVNYSVEEILACISHVCSLKESLNYTNPYEGDSTSRKAYEIIVDFLNHPIGFKSFYDLTSVVSDS